MNQSTEVYGRKYSVTPTSTRQRLATSEFGNTIALPQCNQQGRPNVNTVIALPELSGWAQGDGVLRITWLVLALAFFSAGAAVGGFLFHKVLAQLLFAVFAIWLLAALVRPVVTVRAVWSATRLLHKTVTDSFAGPTHHSADAYGRMSSKSLRRHTNRNRLSSRETKRRTSQAQ